MTDSNSKRKRGEAKSNPTIECEEHYFALGESCCTYCGFYDKVCEKSPEPASKKPKCTDQDFLDDECISLDGDGEAQKNKLSDCIQGDNVGGREVIDLATMVNEKLEDSEKRGDEVIQTKLSVERKWAKEIDLAEEGKKAVFRHVSPFLLALRDYENNLGRRKTHYFS